MSISIGKRILLGFAALTLVVLALGFYALNQIAAVRDSTDMIVARDLALLRQIDELGNMARGMGIVRRDAVIAALARAQGRSLQDEDYLNAWRRLASEVETTLTGTLRATNDYSTNASSTERANAWQRLNASLSETAAAFRQSRSVSEAQFTAIASGDIAGAETRNKETSRDYEIFLRGIDNAREILDGAIAIGQRRVRDIYEQSRLSIWLTLAAAALLAVLITGLISRAVVRPLEEVMEFAAEVGTGDLTRRLTRGGHDEVARLGATLNDMVGGLADLARSNRSATADLNAAASQIRASAQEQAASVEEQFAAVQETAATVDEITHSGAQISKRASEVIATAQATAQTAKAGLRAAGDAARAMDLIRDQGESVAGNIVALSEKTQAIGEIIATVNDISERTHLLALNAAIEAAAAGESGRSFAIVASEMKLLADQAKTATGQVRAILSEIQRGINASVMLTEEAVKRAANGKSRTDATVQTIEELAARAEESVHTFQQIVASTNQQQLGIEQVMGALQNIRQASQQTAAGTREVEMATANVTELAQALMTLAERYRV